MNTPHNPDDELGTALGDSIRNRVDHIPTATPGFEDVERRARQITNRRRALAGAAVGAFLLLGGIGIASLAGDDSAADQDTVDSPDDSLPVDDDSDDPAPPDDSPAPTGDLAGVVTGLIEKSRFVRSSILESIADIELYAAAPGEVLSEALLLADGSILVEVHDDPLAGAGRVLHLTEPGATPTELSAFGDLAGGAVVDGVPYAWVGDVPDFRNGLPGQDQMTGDLRRIDLRDHSSTTFVEFAYGIENSVDTVDVRGGLVLVSISSEGGPTWRVHDLDGHDLGFPMPIDRSDHPARGGDVIASWPRFDAEGDGLRYLTYNLDDGSRALVGVNFDGTERTSIPLLPSDADTGASFELQGTGDLIAVNVLTFDDAPRYVETIWVGGDSGPSNEVEPGEVIFVQPAQSSAGSPVLPTPPTEPSEPVVPGEWRPLADLGLAGPRGSLAFDITSPIDTATALVGVVDTNVVRYDADGTATTLLGDPDITAARIAADESVLIELANRPPIGELRPSAVAVIQIRDDEYRVLSADGRLNGVAEVQGRTVAFVGDFPVFDNTPEGDTGDLRMVDLETGESTVIGVDVFGIEWLIYEAFVGGDPSDPVILLDGAGYQPFWAYRDLDGNLLELASPTDGRYGPDWANEVDGVGPNADRPALSSDGTTLYWVEVEPGDPALLTPTAVIHSMDVATGDEGPTIDVSLGFTEIALFTDLTISGDELLLTRGFDSVDENGDYTPEYLAPVVVDLTTGEATTLALPGADWHFVG